MPINPSQILQQRMNKFKFEPPQEHRRSLQQPKNEHLTITNLLDKCTQIVREDRLWLRTQIKNNNSEVLDIFKQYPRPSQIQNLQVKLRKYVQTVKNQIKAEQLNRFKNSLHLNSTQTQPAPVEPKRNNSSVFRPPPSMKKFAPFKPNSSVDLNKTANPRLNRSQEHHSTATNLNMNSSLRHFQDLLKYKYNQEVIEERDSENVTSARLARQESEQNKAKPLQEHHIQNRGNLKNNYQTYSKKTEEKVKPQFFKVQAKPVEEPVKRTVQPWQFDKKAVNILYHNQEKKQEKEQQKQISKSRKDYNSFDDKEESIFDQHFNESSKTSIHNEQPEITPIFNLNQFKAYNYISQQTSKHPKEENADFFKHQPWVSTKNNINNSLKQSAFKSTDGEPLHKSKKNQAKEESLSPKVDQTLFTPLQLLNQCRNFLKNRDTSLKKSNLSEQFQKPAEISQSKLFTMPQQEALPECLYNRNNIKQDSHVKQTIQETKRQDQSYLYPEIKDSDMKKVEAKEEVYQINQFQTFNNQYKSGAFSSKMPHIMGNPPRMSFDKLPTNFNIENFLQDLMQITEMNPFITISSLSKYINSHKMSSILKTILAKYLLTSNKDEICLTAIAMTLNKSISETQGKPYPHTDKTINSVYDLLDIDQKDYITKDDINSFLSQIEQAEVDNFDQVSDELWRLFDGADFDNQQQLTYWHLFLVKNSEEFMCVAQLLSQFDFEIERNS